MVGERVGWAGGRKDEPLRAMEAQAAPALVGAATAVVGAHRWGWRGSIVTLFLGSILNLKTSVVVVVVVMVASLVMVVVVVLQTLGCGGGGGGGGGGCW